MPRLTEGECRRRWDDAVRARSWHRSKFRFVMFDYRLAEHGRTVYHPAPAWPTIADAQNTVDAEDYARLERDLFAQAESHSRRGAAAHGSGVQLVATPLPITRGEIVGTIEAVMGKVHPLAVTQEQILRAAFFAHLPGEIRLALGTANAGVHPERPTPSTNYVFKGTRGVGMRARYDLGFGHPTDSAGIAGVGELKAGLATFDRLDALSRWSEPKPDVAEAATSEDKLEEPLLLDLLKLLDPKLPQGAFRISWIASGKRGQSATSTIRERAVRVVERVAKKRRLSGGEYEADPATGWLVCSWTEASVRLELAWYRPAVENPAEFEPVFAAEKSPGIEG